MDQKTLGEQIRQYRGEHDLTQGRICKLCGIGFLTGFGIGKRQTKSESWNRS